MDRLGFCIHRVLKPKAGRLCFVSMSYKLGHFLLVNVVLWLSCEMDPELMVLPCPQISGDLTTKKTFLPLKTHLNSKSAHSSSNITNMSLI